MIAKFEFIEFSAVCALATINSFIIQDPSYSPDYYSTFDRYKKKETFLDKRKQNRVAARRVQLLDQYLSNNSVYVDGIMHQIVDKNHKELTQVNSIENAFRNLIGLNGVKFTYKRDQYWRTWRKVEFPEGEKIVCYRCESSVNCTNCQSNGYWVIDEDPPCPYEILSVISNEEVCAFDITNSTNLEEPCPSVAQFIDITRMCDNPIHTVWRVQKDYSTNVSEHYPAIICGGRDFCDVTTYYLITRNYVTFRITNSTNHILYSRVMKNDKINYACVADCGTIDPNTKTVSKTDNSLVVEMINNKNKREDKTQSSDEILTTSSRTTTTITAKESTEVISESKYNKLKHAFNEMEAVNFEGKPLKKHRHRHTKHLSCSSMKRDMENDNLSEEVHRSGPFH